MKDTRTHHPTRAKKPRTAVTALLCASLAATLLPAAALASQTGMLKSIATKNITSIAEGTITSNDQARWALGEGGNLAISGTGAICADDGLYDICDQVEHIFIGKEITKIEPEAFCYFTRLKSVEFEEGSQLSVVGAYAFSGCSSLEYIELPASAKTIETAAFLDCSKLLWAKFGSSSSSLCTIGASAFSNCRALSEIELPKSLKTIGDYAFSGCDALTSITIPAKVETVGEGAFENCPQLTGVKVESPTTTKINGYAFAGSTKAKPKTASVKKIKAAKKSLKITWQKIPGATSYKLYYKQATASKWKSVQTKRASKTIKKLKRGKRYKIYVAAQEKGKLVCKSAIETSPKVR